jgi:hypothetical protein
MKTKFQCNPTKSRDGRKVYALSIFAQKLSFGPGIGTWSFYYLQNRLPWHRWASPSATLDGIDRERYGIAFSASTDFYR